MFDGTLHNFTGINRAGGQRSLKEVFHLDNLILDIEENNLKDLRVKVSHRVIQIIKHLLGRAIKWFVHDSLLKKFPGYLLHKLDSKGIMRTNSVDFL